MGPFTIIAGANASGKSNVRDALRFLHGVGRGYTLAEILGGRYGPGGEAQWGGVRGAPSEIARLGTAGFAVEAGMRIKDVAGLADPRSDGPSEATYEVAVNAVEGRWSSGQLRVTRERLGRHGPPSLGVEADGRDESIYTSHPAPPDPVARQEDETHLLLRMGKTARQKKYGHRVAVRPDQPALNQLREHKHVLRLHKKCADAVASTLSEMRFLDPSPDRMREPSPPGQTILGDQGNNLSTALKAICQDADTRKALIEWTRELTPMDVEDFEFSTDPVSGKVQLLIEETNGRKISAYSASDGTLRFLAVLAALFGRDRTRLYFFEEIDNGIHPSRLRLLLELIEQRTADGMIQVVTTTHSPELLAMVGDGGFGNTAVVCRRPNTDDALVRQVADLPNAGELRQSQGLGTLHSAGWLEDAVFLSSSTDEPKAGSEAGE